MPATKPMKSLKKLLARPKTKLLGILTVYTCNYKIA